MVHNEVALPQYTLAQLIEAADTMRSKYSILHYDPKKDKFTGYYYKNQRWTTGCYKLMHSLSALTIILHLFPSVSIMLLQKDNVTYRQVLQKDFDADFWIQPLR